MHVIQRTTAHKLMPCASTDRVLGPYCPSSSADAYGRLTPAHFLHVPSHSLLHTRIIIPTSSCLPNPLHVVSDWWSSCLSGSGPHTRNHVTSPR